MEPESDKSCCGDGCFARDWCERHVNASPPYDFVESPIDKMTGRCAYFQPISDEYRNAVPT